MAACRCARLLSLAVVLSMGCGRIDFVHSTDGRDAGPDGARDAGTCACTACETCTAGSCNPLADGTTCPVGVCVAGECCSPACAASECGDDGCGGACGVCSSGERCEVNACVLTSCTSDGDCLECETCASFVCIPRAEDTACAGGTCHGGVCCTGCWDGAACRVGSSIGACGAAGQACFACIAPANATPQCGGGDCGYLCNDSFDDCDGDDATGCEVNTGSDPRNCGSCDVMCAGDMCIGGACPSSADGGVADGGTSACLYRCDVDVAPSAHDCMGAVAGAFGMGPAAGRFTAIVDMTGATELFMSVTICDPVGWVVHVGDSPSNNGGGGDASQFSNDAEVHLQDEVLNGFSNQMHPSAPATLLVSDPDYIISTGCTTFTWIVEDQRFRSDVHAIDQSSPYLLRIDPPSDSEGMPDALFYVALNRTYADASRNGSGVRAATFCLR